MPILGGCLCFDLPTGCKIIGAIYVVCAILNTLMLAVANLLVWAFDFLPKLIAGLHKMITQNDMESRNSILATLDEELRETTGDGIIESEDSIDDGFDTLEKNTFIVQIVFLVLLIVSFLSIITSSMLIHGVRKSRRGMLVPWVLQEFLHIFIQIAMMVGIFLLFGAIKVSWTLVLPMILTSLIQVFFIIVVISQFQALGLIRMHDEMCMK